MIPNEDHAQRGEGGEKKPTPEEGTLSPLEREVLEGMGEVGPLGKTLGEPAALSEQAAALSGAVKFYFRMVLQHGLTAVETVKAAHWMQRVTEKMDAILAPTAERSEAPEAAPAGGSKSNPHPGVSEGPKEGDKAKLAIKLKAALNTAVYARNERKGGEEWYRQQFGTIAEILTEAEKLAAPHQGQEGAGG